MPPGIGYGPGGRNFITQVDPSLLQAAPGPSGLMALLQRPGVQQGMLATGMALLAQKDQRGSLGGALGRALPYGVQAFQQGKQEGEWEKILASIPDGPQKQMLAMLGPQAGAGALMQMMQGREPKVHEGREGEFFRETPDGGLEQLTELPEEDTRPADQRIFEWLQTQSPDVQAAYRETFGPAPGVTVNTGDQAASAASQALGGDAGRRIVAKSQAAENAVGIAENIRAAEELLDRPEARRVTGPGSTVKTMVERFRGDPAGREIAAQFDILTSDVMLQVIDNFQGALSDKELAFIEKASAADRNMTVEELRSGLGLLRRITERDINSYVQEVENFSPAEFGVTDEQMRQYRALANRAQGALAMPDPLGIR